MKQEEEKTMNSKTTIKKIKIIESTGKIEID